LIPIQLNGEAREVPEGLTLAALLDWLKLPADRVAVERNLEIVPRDNWLATDIHVGDCLEVVHFVGGGALGCETDDGRRLMADRESAVVN
jgi:thiamine biosynthesis protein ThiS